MNKESLKEYLSSRYQGWSSFLNNVIFPIFGEDDFEDGFETELLESQPERRQLAEATGIRSIKQVGMMYVGVEPLQIFDVTVSDRVMMEHNRVNIQRLIRAVMDQFSCAFMLFHYEDSLGLAFHLLPKEWQQRRIHRQQTLYVPAGAWSVMPHGN